MAGITKEIAQNAVRITKRSVDIVEWNATSKQSVVFTSAKVVFTSAIPPTQNFLASNDP